MFNGEQPQFDIFHAASIGDSQFVKQFLLSNDPNSMTNDDGWTPLMYASHYGHYGVVRMLLEAGAESDRCDHSSGRTALMLASANGHTRCVEFLVNIGGANVKQTDQCGNNAGNYAQQNGHGGNKLIAEALGLTNSARRTPKSRNGSGKSERSKPKLNPNCSPFTPSQELRSMQKLISSPFQISSLFEPQSSECPRTSTPGRYSDYITSPGVSSRNRTLDSQLDFSGTSDHSHLIESVGNTFNIFQDQSSQVPSTTDQLLRKLDLTQYQHTFDKHCIDLVVFQSLSDNELLEIGVTPLGHRQKLKAAQKQIRGNLDSSKYQNHLLLEYYFAQEKEYSQQEQINALKAELQSLKQQLSNFTANYNRSPNFNHSVTLVK